MSREDHERHTSILFGWFLPSPAMIPIIRYQQAFRTAIYWDQYTRAPRKWWTGEGGTGVSGVWLGDLMRRKPFS
jgi:hypothetical protein